jgi:predicted hotdog family 3-hydroxylacyl-ACP dehydratase
LGIPEISLDSAIEIFIPQRSPFVMVDKILSTDTKQTTTSFVIKEDNIFCSDGHLLEPGIIENIAQSAAAWAGYIAVSSGKEPMLGFIGAIKNLVIHFLPKVNNKLITTITIDYEVLNALLISAKSFLENNIVAECELKIFLQK